MKVSICMPWRNRVREATVSFPTWLEGEPDEIVIVDDGSDDGLEEFLLPYREKLGRRLVYERLEDTGYKRYPLRAFNRCMELATGDVLVQQSPEVAHLSPGFLHLLTQSVPPGGMAIARVFDAPIVNVRTVLSMDLEDREEWCFRRKGRNWSVSDAKMKQHELPEIGDGWRIYTGHERPLPFFFCGAIRRETWFKMGAYDEDLAVTRDFGADADFAKRMIDAGRAVNGLSSALAVHIQHPRT